MKLFLFELVKANRYARFIVSANTMYSAHEVIKLDSPIWGKEDVSVTLERVIGLSIYDTELVVMITGGRRNEDGTRR